MGVDKAHSTPLPTPLPSRKPPRNWQPRAQTCQPPTQLPADPQRGGPWLRGAGGPPVGRTRREGECSGSSGPPGVPWRSSRGASHRPPPHLPAVLVTKQTENLQQASGLGYREEQGQDQSAQRGLPVGQREDDRTQTIIRCLPVLKEGY